MSAGRAAAAFARYAEGCPNRLALDVPRRPGNALNVEVGAPLPRCRLRPPAHWPASHGALRWLGSGGSPLVFGPCSATGCPLAPRHCDACGHRAEHHGDARRGCLVAAPGAARPCGCRGEDAP